ncbi:MAG: septal ring lytic transglycosylase RlpA family protein [Proteobacteria bacterium]|nr:septal ring lytic transglycosylase RlpA family protein [Pseudomonadota bacterium]
MTLNASSCRSHGLVHILSLILLLALAFGCSSKTGDRGEFPAKSGKKGPRIPATQRPYVINGITYYPIPSAIGYVEQGIASWYGEPFHGKKTANGEVYDMYSDTAAHKTLPMNTVLLVKNLENGRSTLVRINDRGPFVQERIIDLTYTKAKELDIVGRGTAKVEIVAMETRQQAAEQVAASGPVKPPVEGGKPTPQPQPPYQAPPVPDFDKGNFYVQVGAFIKIEDARTLAKAFAKRGRDVVIQQYPAAGMNLYRVMIFASNSLAKAKVFEKELKAEGFRYALLLAR